MEIKKRICFAVLVHEKKEIVIDLIDNIRYFCPNSSIVLFNGGDDPNLCQGLGCPVCPTSRKLKYGTTATYMLEVMSWLEGIKFDYDYLINLDSDILFVREGYEKFIIDQMKDKDYMGVNVRTAKNGWYCYEQIKKEWNMWRPLFKTDKFLGTFNVGQVFSKKLVKKLLTCKKIDQLRENLLVTKSFGIDEIAYVTMVKTLGFKPKSYPHDANAIIRYRPYYSHDEAFKLLNNHTAFLLHPVKRKQDNGARTLIKSIMYWNFRENKNLRIPFLDDGFIPDSHLISGSPSFVRTKRDNQFYLEMVAPLKEKCLGHWWRKSEPGSPWYGPYIFGCDKVEAVAAIQNHHGNLEVIARVKDKLFHYWCSHTNGNISWNHSTSFGDGITGNPLFIESKSGNCEVVAPIKKGGVVHWERNINKAKLRWKKRGTFGSGKMDPVSMNEDKNGKLRVVVHTGEEFQYFRRVSKKEWSGPIK